MQCTRGLQSHTYTLIETCRHVHVYVRVCLSVYYPSRVLLSDGSHAIVWVCNRKVAGAFINEDLVAHFTHRNVMHCIVVLT